MYQLTSLIRHRLEVILSRSVVFISEDGSRVPRDTSKVFFTIFSLLRLTICLTCYRLTMSLKFLDKSAALFQQNFHDSRGVLPRLLNFNLKAVLLMTGL